MNKTGLSRRGIVRLCSYTLALIVALTAGTIGGYTTARRHRAAIEYGYQRALGELTEYLGNLDITLDKGKYAATSGQLQKLSAKLWREAGYAKGALNQLPMDGGELSGTYKFLSQVGDFCMTLSDRVAQGGTVSEDEAATLKKLIDYSHDVYTQVAKMQSAAAAGVLSFADAAEAAETESGVSLLSDGFHDMEEGFEDYPTLIYDGPFSDHIQQQKPKFLTGKGEISAEAAAQKAAKWTDKALTADGEIGGNLPCYRFTADDLYLTVTKAGGYIQSLLHSRPIDEARLTVEEALKKGDRFLEDKGIIGFRQSYYSLNRGVLTINYAYAPDTVVFYPDLIKIGVAMDNGEIVSFDGTGCLMNHTDRVIPDVSWSADEARARLSPLLEVEETCRMVVIPGEDRREILCYEFICKGENDERVLVYIGAQTGEEEQILILLEDETGVLVM